MPNPPSISSQHTHRPSSRRPGSYLPKRRIPDIPQRHRLHLSRPSPRRYAFDSQKTQTPYLPDLVRSSHPLTSCYRARTCMLSLFIFFLSCPLLVVLSVVCAIDRGYVGFLFLVSNNWLTPFFHAHSRSSPAIPIISLLTFFLTPMTLPDAF